MAGKSREISKAPCILYYIAMLLREVHYSKKVTTNFTRHTYIYLYQIKTSCFVYMIILPLMKW